MEYEDNIGSRHQSLVLDFWYVTHELSLVIAGFWKKTDERMA
jgi:hypothetical protein